MVLPVLFPIAAAGYLAYRFLTRGSEEPGFSCNLNCTGYRTGRSGHGVGLDIELPDVTADGEYVIIGLAMAGGAPIKSLHADYADSDGDLITAGEVTFANRKAQARAFIPFAAFPEPQMKIELKLALLRDGSPVGRVAFEFDIDARQFERHNDIAAVCDAAIGAIRQDRTVERNDIAAARKRVVEAYDLDKFGTAFLKARLKAAVASAPHDAWFDPHKIARDIRDDTVEQALESVMRLIVAIAAANGSIGDKGLEYLRLLSGALGLTLAQFERIAEPFRGLGALLAMFGLSADADRHAVARAYRRAAKECHPDLQQGKEEAQRREATERFQRITDAYDAIMARMSAA